MDALSTLIAFFKKVAVLGGISAQLSWDTELNLPTGASEYRGEQRALIETLIHQECVRPELAQALAEAEKNAVKGTDTYVICRETRWIVDRATKLSPEFVAEGKRLEQAGFEAWKEARTRNDFKIFAPVLKKLLEHAKEEARLVGTHANPYDYFLSAFDRDLNCEILQRLFDDLKSQLKISQKELPAAATIKHHLSERDITQLTTELMQHMGFDFEHGRADKTLHHPMTIGDGHDCRVTFKTIPEGSLESLLDTFLIVTHETGHALYEQGLPKAHLGTPLGNAVSYSIHESQSRFWENMAGRSRVFWQYWYPILQSRYGEPFTSVNLDEFYKIINTARPSLIRVHADEATYNLHIILRFEIEKRLFDGSLAVDDIPAFWREKSKELLGLEPQNDVEGALQDVHWSGCSFGYFPSYAVANLISAQLREAMTKDVNIDDCLLRGDYKPILEWLHTHIHQYGMHYLTLELVERATGKPLSSEAFIRHIKARYQI